MRHLSGGEAGGAEKHPRILKEQRNKKGNGRERGPRSRLEGL